MTYDPCPIADQIRAARAAGAEPGTAFLPRPPRRPRNDVQPTRKGGHRGAYRAQRKLLKSMGIGSA